MNIPDVILKIASDNMAQGATDEGEWRSLHLYRLDYGDAVVGYPVYYFINKKGKPVRLSFNDSRAYEDEKWETQQ